MQLRMPLTMKIMYAEESKNTPYVAYCPELDIASAGKDAMDAQRMLDEAIGIVLNDAAKQGTLDEYLSSVGFARQGRKFFPPKILFETYAWDIPKTLEKTIACLE